MANEFGDFQTSKSLSDQVCKIINNNNKYINIIEPTFGTGSFLISAINTFNKIKSINGCEINKKYYNYALKSFNKTGTKTKSNLSNENIFNIDVNNLFDFNNQNLIIGNLPWVTNSQLSVFESKNVPKKNNIKGLKGYDALTGKSNFDISEFISLKLLKVLSKTSKNGTFAMLLKNSVIQKIAKYIPNSNLFPTSFSVYKFSAKKEFNANTDAGLVIIKFNEKESSFNNIINVYNLYNPSHLINRYGWVNSRFVSNVDNYKSNAKYDADTKWDWRSGIKHDASKVLELQSTNTKLKNKLNEIVNVEDKYIYPLVKGSDINKRPIQNNISKFILITQKNMDEDTQKIEQDSNMWDYLINHNTFFSKRKSTIYKNKPKYSIFGVGSYSFKNFKVAISSMYKEPYFSILPIYKNKPIMVDDTVNFIGFDKMIEAIIFSATMNSYKAQQLIKSLTFKESKRPYTINILKRIDTINILKDLSIKEINSYSVRTITLNDKKQFIKKYSNKDIKLI